MIKLNTVLLSTGNITVSGYTARECNNVIFIFASLLNRNQHLKERIYCFRNIGIGRFRILRGQSLEYCGGGGGKGGANSQQAHDVVLTLMRRNDVASTSFRRHVTN